MQGNLLWPGATVGADADLSGFFGCADVDNLRLLFDMEVGAFWIVVVGPKLKRWFIILILACILLLSYAISSERISFSKVGSEISKECKCSTTWPG